MRLKAIKLAGFKSFVDPTRISFPSDMCAVVGPNGCGKSNIIDAVRWVMGESSAKNLRGESMTDVIFNGSRGRGPAGQASVELVFDNSDHTLTGAYAAYNEISVKRRVTRDSKNNYFLNGSPCRRRDILDIFLGTGLGPRSYAIISQGIISNLIESKPDELRVFIEEAAGISKYKERRRETGHRIRRTQENLERLADLRNELDRQLERLSRQAQAAEQYQQYKTAEQRKKAELLALRWRELHESCQQRALHLQGLELEFERQVASQRSAESQVEVLRQEQSQGQDQVQLIQQHYYRLAGEISALEQRLEHQRARRQELKSDLQGLEVRLTEEAQLLADDHAQLELLDEELLTVEAALELERDEQAIEHERLDDAETAMQLWQERWAEYNQQQAIPEQQAQGAQRQLEQLERQRVRGQQRLERLRQELEPLSKQADDEQMSLLLEEREELALEGEELEEALQTAQERLAMLNEQLQQGESRRLQYQSKLSELGGFRASLQALQEAGSANRQKQQDYLRTAQLDQYPRLFEQLQVEPGWEIAVEQVLGPSLQAVCLDRLDTLASQTATASGLRFCQRQNLRPNRAPGTQPTLAGKVHSKFAPEALLEQVFIADSREAAWAMRRELSPLQSVVTPCGCWLGYDWLVFSHEDSPAAGVLARQQQLQALGAEILEYETQLFAVDEDLQTQSQERQQALNTLQQTQQQLSGNSAKIQQLQLQIERLHTVQEQQRHRRAQVERELIELGEQETQEREQVAELELELEQARDAISAAVTLRESLLDERDRCRTTLDQLRQAYRQQQDRLHQHQLRQQTLTTQRQSLQQGIDRLRAQSAQNLQRKSQLVELLNCRAEPQDDLASELEVRLEERLLHEEQLQQVRAQLTETEQQLAEVNLQREQALEQVEQLRDQLERARLDQQGGEVLLDTLASQVDETVFELSTLLQTLPAQASGPQWEEELAAIARRIQRLGAINLAAIEEFEVQQQRKAFLDRQNDDLLEALETLESAIRRIDRETRSRFKTTFEQINQGLQQLFPRVFGGGRAYLQMTGDDLLNTGVAIMAQPPGKKNSTIHLLSGGEKALTAIALVFAIFQLNPAPFCLLDEVDAPLDDANVSRYAAMVKEMAEQVQFIYITHNKIAMEAANQLIGVTMQEPGVSRPVTVDIEQAARMADAEPASV